MTGKNRNLILAGLAVLWFALFFLCYLSGYVMHEVGHVF